MPIVITTEGELYLSLDGVIEWLNVSREQQEIPALIKFFNELSSYFIHLKAEAETRYSEKLTELRATRPSPND